MVPTGQPRMPRPGMAQYSGQMTVRDEFIVLSLWLVAAVSQRLLIVCGGS